MATFTWDLQGTTDTTIVSTDTFQFAGGTFDDPVQVGEYQDSSHVKDDTNSDKSSGNGPNNTKFISSTEVDIGGGTVNLSSLTDADASLKINFAHGSSVQVTDHIFYAYDGTTTTNGPTDVTFQAAEIGDSSWTQAQGSGSAVAVADSASATSHDFFFAVSASPDTVGTKSAFTLRDELTYS